jgi:hypothetical protein
MLGEMMAKLSFGILLMMGVICLIGAMMWSTSVTPAWQDINETTNGTSANVASQTGLISAGSFGIALAAMGILLTVGAIIVLIRETTGVR